MYLDTHHSIRWILMIELSIFSHSHARHTCRKGDWDRDRDSDEAISIYLCLLPFKNDIASNQLACEPDSNKYILRSTTARVPSIPQKVNSFEENLEPDFSIRRSPTRYKCGVIVLLVSARGSCCIEFNAKKQLGPAQGAGILRESWALL